MYAVMETGIYNQAKAPIPIKFNKVLSNNVLEDDPKKHRTPLGAGTLLWANERVTLQPAAKELNYDKLQTTIAIVKTPSGNYNLLMMTLHVPNKLSS